MPDSHSYFRVLSTAGPSVQDLLIGAGVGSVVGKLVVHWSEQRREKELPAPRVRGIEVTWISIGVTIRFILWVIWG